jgi:SAM-dependent methyltransferase
VDEKYKGMLMSRFYTDYCYTDRRTKAKYVWLKYGSILDGCVLDVGADERYLKQCLPEGTEYMGIGLEGHPDQQVDLEKENIPFPNSSFDCVLCLDVLEHLDNIHDVFDELCRVTRQYVIISLPNPWASFIHVLCFGTNHVDKPMKFYGLPPDKPEDRHKWFFSNQEAMKFVSYRAARNGMEVLQIDNYTPGGNNCWLKRLLRRAAGVVLQRTSGVHVSDLYAGTLWVVLEKRDQS